MGGPPKHKRQKRVATVHTEPLTIFRSHLFRFPFAPFPVFTRARHAVPLTLAAFPLLNCTEFDRISNGSRAHKHGHQSPCVQHARHVVTSCFSSCVVTSRATSHRNVEATAGAARGDASYPPVSCAFMIACFMLLVVACRTHSHRMSIMMQLHRMSHITVACRMYVVCLVRMVLEWYLSSLECTVLTSTFVAMSIFHLTDGQTCPIAYACLTVDNVTLC